MLHGELQETAELSEARHRYEYIERCLLPGGQGAYKCTQGESVLPTHRKIRDGWGTRSFVAVGGKADSLPFDQLRVRNDNQKQALTIAELMDGLKAA